MSVHIIYQKEIKFINGSSVGLGASMSVINSDILLRGPVYLNTLFSLF